MVLHSHSEGTREMLEKLSSLVEAHFNVGAAVIQADDNSLYLLDLLAVATLNRSLNLLVGFRDLISARNFIAGAPLVRLQLDNVLRFFAGTLVDDPHDFAFRILQGTPVRRMKDRKGHQMTDRYLVETLTKRIPWIRDVYEHGSAHVHLSEKHILSSLGDVEGNTFQMKVSIGDAFVSDKVYEETVSIFQACTEVLLELAQLWSAIKEDPTLVPRNRPNSGDQSSPEADR